MTIKKLFLNFAIVITIISPTVSHGRIKSAKERSDACVDILRNLSKNDDATSVKIRQIVSVIDKNFDGQIQLTKSGQPYITQGFYKTEPINAYLYPTFAKYRWIVDDLLSLPPQKRKQIYTGLKQRYGDLTKILPEEILLCFDEVDLWLNKLKATLTDANEQRSYEMLDPNGGYYDQLEATSAATKEVLLQAIAKAYPTAKKAEEGTGPNPPKRQLDGWINALVHGDQIFLEKYKATKNPVKAYDAYLDAIESKVIEKMSPSQRARYGQLNATDIIKLARIMQKSLADAKIVGEIKITSEYELTHNYGQARLLFHGSVTKGFAKDESDIDLAVPASHDYFWGGLMPMLSDLRLAIKREIPLDLEVVQEVGDWDEAMHQVPIIEPIMIEVSAKAIYILVSRSPAAMPPVTVKPLRIKVQ